MKYATNSPEKKQELQNELHKVMREILAKHIARRAEA